MLVSTNTTKATVRLTQFRLENMPVQTVPVRRFQCFAWLTDSCGSQLRAVCTASHGSPVPAVGVVHKVPAIRCCGCTVFVPVIRADCAVPAVCTVLAVLAVPVLAFRRFSGRFVRFSGSRRFMRFVWLGFLRFPRFRRF